ncbi:MAG: hypothetical protein ABIO57_02870 [Candidatus Paceibacterota bacterium]
MIRTILWIVFLILAVLYVPLWLQLALFVAAIIIGPYRFFMVLPAIISDALYAPGSFLSISHHWMTILILALLGIHYVVMKKLRIRTVYGLEA